MAPKTSADSRPSSGSRSRAFVREGRDLMILDEPSSGLDPEAEYEIHTRVREYRARFSHPLRPSGKVTAGPVYHRTPNLVRTTVKTVNTDGHP
jgi:ABC-type transporter Mla maintaining outer membrane lipid asymmetry ATPase subunit MlaF